MTHATTSNQEWIQKITSILQASGWLDSLPKETGLVSSSIANIQKSIAEVVKDADIELTVHSAISKGFITEKMTAFGEDPFTLFFQLTPFPEKAILILPRIGIAKFTQNLVAEKKVGPFIDRELQEAFLGFITIQILEKMAPLEEEITPQLLLVQPLPEEEHIFIDFRLKGKESLVVGSLFLPLSFWDKRESIRSAQALSPLENKACLQQTVELQLWAGRTFLELEEWKRARIGDVILLDSCSYDLEHHKGSVIIALEGEPILQARVKNEGLKVLEKIMEEELSTEPLEPLTEGVTLDIEVGRMYPLLKELLFVEPETILDGNVRPENMVKVVLHKQVVAKGDLVHLGDSVGVRLSQIYSSKEEEV